MAHASLKIPLAVSLACHLALGVVVVRGLRAPPPPAAAPDPRTHEAVGDSFEVPDEESIEIPDESTATTEGAGTEPARLPGHARGRRGRHGSVKSEGHGPPTASASDAVFGAAGERGATDLATAFTRGFPQAASADPVWARVPLGSAGEADVVLAIDPGGALVDSSILGNPSPALRAGIARTLALIGNRAFTSAAARTHLHVSATVAPDAVHDGLHGEVFAIGGSFASAFGSAFFALAIGRRVDLQVRVRP